MFPAPNAYTPLSWRQNTKIVSTVSKMIRLDGILLSNLVRSLVREYKKYKNCDEMNKVSNVCWR